MGGLAAGTPPTRSAIHVTATSFFLWLLWAQQGFFLQGAGLVVLRPALRRAVSCALAR